MLVALISMATASISGSASKSASAAIATSASRFGQPPSGASLPRPVVSAAACSAKKPSARTAVL